MRCMLPGKSSGSREGGTQNEEHLHKDSSPIPNPSFSYHTAKIPSVVGELWDALFIHPMEKILISYLLGPHLKQQISRGKVS